MRDALLNILGVKGLLTDVKNSTYANHVLPIKSAPPKRNGQDWLKAYNESPRLAPVTKMSLDISTTKGNVYRVNKKTGTKVLVPNHPLLELLYQPNPYYNTSGSADLYLMQVHFIVRGEAFAIIERDANNEPSFLWLLPPDWVTDIPNKETPYYKVKGPSGNEFKVEQEDMFYRKNPNPINPIGRGIGRVEQIGDEIETDEYMAKFAKRFFFNDATPNIIVTAPDAAEDDEIRVAERR